jgi:hypothetical protein
VSGNSWDALAWAARQKTGGPGPKAVLLSLAKRVDEQWSCFPGQEVLADETEQSVRTVQRQLADLEQRGMIRREARGKAGGGRTSDRYFLLVNGKHDNLSGNPAGADRTRQPDGANTTQVSGLNTTTVSGEQSGLTTSKNKQIGDNADDLPSPGPEGEQGELIPVVEPVVRKTRAKPKTFIPADWTPGLAHVATAKERGWTRDQFEHELVQFRNHWQAKGQPMADWDACFRTWTNNAERWARERGPRNGFSPTTTRPQPTSGGVPIEGPAAY